MYRTVFWTLWGEGKGRMIWENGTDTCVLSDVKWIASPGSMHGTGCLGLVHWDDPEGWDGEGCGRRFRMGNTCIPVADSWQCMAKPLQYCKVISLKLINLLKNKSNKFFCKKKRILEWVAISSSQRSSQPRDQTWVSCVSCPCRQILYYCTTWKASMVEHTFFFFTVIFNADKEVNLNIPWKDWYWCWSSSMLANHCEEPSHWKRPWCWERLRAGEVSDRGWDNITDSMAMSLSKLQEIVTDREAWHAAVLGVTKSDTLSDWTTIVCESNVNLDVLFQGLLVLTTISSPLYRVKIEQK